MNRNVVLFPTLLALSGALFGACSSDNNVRQLTEAGTNKDGGDFVPEEDAGLNCEDPESFNSCAISEPGVTKAPAYIYIVLDGSGSMIGDKWDAAVEALDAVFGDMNAQADPTLAVGMMVFEDDLATGKYPGPKDILPGFVDQTQYLLLRNRIDKSGASGGTPTYAALTGAYTVMKSYQPSGVTPPNGNRVVVLMSDGEPTDDAAGCIKIAKSNLISDPPIKTFSVGIGPFPSGSGYDPEFMGNIALAGGTPATPTCKADATNLADICHFQITPGGDVQKLKADFIEALNKIRGLSTGCEFVLEETGSLDPAQTTVIFTDGNGKSRCVEKDDGDGWSFDDPDAPTKIILNGQSCGDATADEESKVKVIVGCKAN